MEDSINPSYKVKRKKLPEKAYNINQNYLLYQPVPFDLDRSFFQQRLGKTGCISRLSKKKIAHLEKLPSYRLVGEYSDLSSADEFDGFMKSNQQDGCGQRI